LILNLDSKEVVDNFLSPPHDAIEFGAIIDNFKSFFSQFYVNCRVETYETQIF